MRTVISIGTSQAPSECRCASGRATIYDERVGQLYAFCREHLFRDDTGRIAAALWGADAPSQGSLLLELGCGPGLYARQLADRFRHLRVVGIDSSDGQIRRARARAADQRLSNCRFERGDVRALGQPSNVAQAVVSSRLLMIVPERELVLREMHRVLRPGGRCFIAEPRSPWRVRLSLLVLRLAAGPDGVRDLRGMRVLTDRQFRAAAESQPWRRISISQDTHYQYAVCEKTIETLGDDTQRSSLPERLARERVGSRGLVAGQAR